MTSPSLPSHEAARPMPQPRRVAVMGVGRWLAPLYPFVAERSPRERMLLALALVGSLVTGIYLLWSQWTPRVEPPPSIPNSTWQGLSAITPVVPDAWRRAAIDHGLALTSIDVDPAGDVVITRARAQSPEAVSQFAQWAAQQGWWALDWTLEREAANRLVINTRWHSQPEIAQEGRQQP